MQNETPLINTLKALSLQLSPTQGNTEKTQALFNEAAKEAINHHIHTLLSSAEYQSSLDEKPEITLTQDTLQTLAIQCRNELKQIVRIVETDQFTHFAIIALLYTEIVLTILRQHGITQNIFGPILEDKKSLNPIKMLFYAAQRYISNNQKANAATILELLIDDVYYDNDFGPLILFQHGLIQIELSHYDIGMIKKGINSISKAASLKHSGAQFELGRLYSPFHRKYRNFHTIFPDEYKRNITLTLQHFESAAEQGNADALVSLGHIHSLYKEGLEYYQEEFFTRCNPKTGAGYYHRVAMLGNLNAEKGLQYLFEKYRNNKYVIYHAAVFFRTKTHKHYLNQMVYLQLKNHKRKFIEYCSQFPWEDLKGLLPTILEAQLYQAIREYIEFHLLELHKLTDIPLSILINTNYLYHASFLHHCNVLKEPAQNTRELFTNDYTIEEIVEDINNSNPDNTMTFLAKIANFQNAHAMNDTYNDDFEKMRSSIKRGASIDWIIIKYLKSGNTTHLKKLLRFGASVFLINELYPELALSMPINLSLYKDIKYHTATSELCDKSFSRHLKLLGWSFHKNKRDNEELLEPTDDQNVSPYYKPTFFIGIPELALYSERTESQAKLLFSRKMSHHLYSIELPFYQIRLNLTDRFYLNNYIGAIPNLLLRLCEQYPRVITAFSMVHQPNDLNLERSSNTSLPIIINRKEYKNTKQIILYPNPYACTKKLNGFIIALERTLIEMGARPGKCANTDTSISRYFSLRDSQLLNDPTDPLVEPSISKITESKERIKQSDYYHQLKNTLSESALNFISMDSEYKSPTTLSIKIMELTYPLNIENCAPSSDTNELASNAQMILAFLEEYRELLLRLSKIKARIYTDFINQLDRIIMQANQSQDLDTLRTALTNLKSECREIKENNDEQYCTIPTLIINIILDRGTAIKHLTKLTQFISLITQLLRLPNYCNQKRFHELSSELINSLFMPSLGNLCELRNQSLDFCRTEDSKSLLLSKSFFTPVAKSTSPYIQPGLEEKLREPHI